MHKWTRMLCLPLGLALCMGAIAKTETPTDDGLAAVEEFLPVEEAPPPPSLLRAEQIQSASFDSFPRGGPDSIAGLGDWWLTNGKICIAVSGINHHAGIVAGGGTLIDVGHCERGDDQWTYANILTGLAKETAIPASKISALIDGGHADIITVGESDGIRQTVTYRLFEGGESLDIDVQIERIGDGRAVQMSGLFTLYSQRALTPFSLSSYIPDATLGFKHPAIDRNKVSSLLEGMLPSDWNILVGADTYDTAISYGVQLASAELIKANGSRQPLPRFLAVFPDYSLHGWMTRPLWFQSERLTWLSLLQNQFMDLEKGERMLAKFKVLLGDRADVATVTDQIYTGPQLRGYVNNVDVSVAVWDQDDRPVTQSRVAADGSFNIRLPKHVQWVKMQATAPWGQKITRELSLADARNDSGRWVFRKNGTLTLPRGVPMSLYFFGFGDTATPEFGNDLLGFTEQGVSLPGMMRRNRIDLAGVDSDLEAIDLPPGQYRVLTARGLEFDVKEYLLTVVAGKTSQLPIVSPKRIWYGGDWHSADLHVHSGASFDSILPFDERLRSFVAQGAEVLVASEHNRLIDQRSRVAALGLEGKVQVVTGSELTGMSRTAKALTTVGHSNAFPLTAKPMEFAGGSPQVEDRALREVIAGVREQSPNAIFQLNHPRAANPIDADLAFFDHLSVGKRYDPMQSLESFNNKSLLAPDPVSGFRDIDFDVIEVLNGAEFAVYSQIRDDWFSLLNQGARRAATGNSDSHGLRSVVAAPRNYVYVPNSNKQLPLDEGAFVDAVRAGHSFATTGPLLAVTLRDAYSEVGMGDTFSGRRGELHVQIDAAPWVTVDTLTLWVNGEIYRQLKVAVGDHKVIEIIASEDSYVVVEVSGQPSAVYRALMPDLAPLALSNPIYIDADGNGEWRAPRIMN
ncbi:CehA/McbA family metallohydrolase [Zhongshania sp. BJYM1]|uniref:CehA/McbA family metallohydrolase n=1 Tax=Zhongshania aquatica TaxID=2965069 RepID=UPI0022B53B64|nr:CehA/McbA family metallohydrolase [Marortus sp. BJYM1]